MQNCYEVRGVCWTLDEACKRSHLCSNSIWFDYNLPCHLYLIAFHRGKFVNPAQSNLAQPKVHELSQTSVLVAKDITCSNDKSTKALPLCDVDLFCRERRGLASHPWKWHVTGKKRNVDPIQFERQQKKHFIPSLFSSFLGEIYSQI